MNRDNLWVSNETCVFNDKNGSIYIENTITTKVLGVINDSIVSWEDYVEGNAQQLWIKGEPTVEGYFTLENVGEPMVITAISESSLEIKGNSLWEEKWSRPNILLQNAKQLQRSRKDILVLFLQMLHPLF